MQGEVSQQVLETRMFETGHRLVILAQAKRAEQIEVQVPCRHLFASVLRVAVRLIVAHRSTPLGAHDSVYTAAVASPSIKFLSR